MVKLFLTLCRLVLSSVLFMTPRDKYLDTTLCSYELIAMITAYASLSVVVGRDSDNSQSTGPGLYFNAMRFSKFILNTKPW